MKNHQKSHKETQYVFKKKYIVRHISDDGLVKPIKGRGGYGYQDYLCDDNYETEEEAIAAIQKEDVYDAVILTQITKEIIWD